MLPSDLQFLTDEDVDEIGNAKLSDRRLRSADVLLLCPTGGALTRVEKKRLQAAVQAACGMQQPALMSCSKQHRC